MSEGWLGLPNQVLAAIVGGLFTLVAATVSVAVVLIQLRRQTKNLFDQLDIQAKNSIAANRHIERTKLKKELYSKIVETVAIAHDTQFQLYSFVSGFPVDIEISRISPAVKPVAN